MSNRLGGKQGTAYLGTNANQPPNWSFENRDPNQFDSQNYSLGDLWLNLITEGTWVLVNLDGNGTSKGALATWVQWGAGSGGVITVNSGNSIFVDNSTPTAPIVNVSGTVTNAIQIGNALGALSSLAPALDGQIPIGSTGLAPVMATITAGAGITVVNAAGSITISAPGAGTVTSVSGANNIVITGPAATPTVNVGNTTNHSVLVGKGAGATGMTSIAVGATNTVLLGNTGADPSFGTVPNAALQNSTITLNNGNNITVTGSPISLGGAATIAVTGTTNGAVQIGNASGSLTSVGPASTGQILIGRTALNPVFNQLTAGAGITIDSVSSPGNITISSSAGGGTLSTLTGDTGGAVSPTAGNINEIGTATQLIVTGTPGTSTLTWSLDQSNTGLFKQSAFLADITADKNNVTGNGANYTVVFNRTYFNTGANFSTVSGIYTAPSAGLYQFNSTVTVGGLTSSMVTGILSFNVSAGPCAGDWSFTRSNAYVVADSTGSGLWRFNGSITVQLNAGNQVSVVVNVQGGAGNTADVATGTGIPPTRTWFSGSKLVGY